MQIKYPKLHAKGYLHRRFVREGISTQQIAAEIGCTSSAVVAALRRQGMRPPTRVYKGKQPLAVTNYCRCEPRGLVDTEGSCSKCGREPQPAQPAKAAA